MPCSPDGAQIVLRLPQPGIEPASAGLSVFESQYGAYRFPIASRMCLSFLTISDRSRLNSPSGTYEGSDSIHLQPFYDLLGFTKPFPDAREDLRFDPDVQFLSIGFEEELGSCICRPPVPAVEGMRLGQLNQQCHRLSVDVSLLILNSAVRDSQGSRWERNRDRMRTWATCSEAVLLLIESFLG